MKTEEKITTWNYRLLAFTFGSDKPYFEIRTVYYTNGKPDSFGDPAHPINGSSVKSAKLTAKLMMKAFEKPVLWGELVGEKNKFPNKYKKVKKK